MRKRIPKVLWCLWAVSLLASSFSAASAGPRDGTKLADLKTKVDHKYIPKPEELKYVFATAAPVLRVQPGDTVQTWTQSALGDYLQKPGDSPSCPGASPSRKG